MSDKHRDGSMSIVDDIYNAADRRGLSLADYIRNTYRGDSLRALERDIKRQLSSLRSDISEFMTEAESESQPIDANLLCANKEKLDLMQERVRENLRKKMEQLESISFIDVSVMKDTNIKSEGVTALSE